MFSGIFDGADFDGRSCQTNLMTVVRASLERCFKSVWSKAFRSGLPRNNNFGVFANRLEGRKI